MRSVDFILAYPQAEVKTDIFMSVPKGASIEGLDPTKHLLKLKRNLYGLRDAGLTWFDCIRAGLIKRGFQQSTVDPCLFTKDSVVLILYVDDAALLSPYESAINKVIASLQQEFTLTDEGDLKDYLGVRISKHADGSVEMIQPRMIERALQIVGLPLNEKSKVHDTPAEVRPILGNDPNGSPRKETWNYRAVIGVLNYLQAMSRPDVAYTVHQCARFCQDPKLSHERAVKRLCRYLLGTKDKGIIFRPDVSLGFQCYVDADWAGNWNKEYAEDPANVHSRTGFLITYAGCPIVWSSKLQPLVALSTTEAELIALSTALREVISLMNLLKELRERNVPVPFTKPRVRCRTFEDNAACIEVANEPKLRPRTKHLAVRLFHFRDHVEKGDITIEHITTQEQIADIFTKPLARDQFKYLRKKFLHW
jgi:histone deacetylase 1/2